MVGVARALAVAGLSAWLAAPVAIASTVREVRIDGAITPATTLRVGQALDDARDANDDLVLLRLDTPGGLVASMESIVKRMLASEVPVAAFVEPPGAHAASAGFFILIAADVAAMSPGTRTGAASVVYGTGQDNRDDDVLLRKANQDAAAMIRTIAEKRSRNIEAAERAVFQAEAFTETAALEAGLIDVVANDVDDLLSRLDGTEIRRFDGSVQVLRLTDPEFVASKIDFKGKILEFVARPEVAYLLLLIGIAGLYVEFYHPGMIVPGVVGAVCLVLFAVSSAVLPVSAIGVLLILLAVVLFVLEIKIVSHGLLTAGGIAALLIGSLILFRGPIPELRVPAALVVPSTLVLGGFLGLVVRRVRGAMREQVETGVEGLVGAIGDVVVPLDPEGKVFVHGEVWNAWVAHGPAPRGARVRVLRVVDLRLDVELLGESIENGRIGR